MHSVTDPVETTEIGPPSAPAVGGGFVLAHLSDPHLSTLKGVHLRELLNKRVLGYLSWRRRRRFEHLPEVLAAAVQDLEAVQPDHIVVTGDLTHIGLPGEFAQVRGWLDGLGGAGRVTVIPGNHEAYVGTPAGETLAQWLPYLASDRSVAPAGDPRAAPFPSLRLRGPLALIGLSSALPTAPFLASGALGRAQLERLDRLLRLTAKRGYIRVVMVHHPPMPGVVAARKHLRDAQALREVLVGAEVVLHGHAHRRSMRMLKSGRGEIPVIGAASVSEISDRPGRGAEYHIYRFSGPGMEVEFRTYDPTTGGFAPSATQSLELPAQGGS